MKFENERDAYYSVFKYPFTQEDVEILRNHIEEHKYFINQSIPFEIDFGQALFSWYENIVRDIERHYKGWVIQFAFPNVNFVEFYFQVVEHWHYLKEKNPNVHIIDAIKNYVKNYSRRKVFGKLFYSFA